MNFLPVPKLLQWIPGLSQQYLCPQTTLVTSGCSFTSSTLQLETAASWPGYVLDRCRFDHCIDYSYPGTGNDYIGDSILYHFKSIDDIELSKYFVIIMWSGIDRVESKILDSSDQPNLGGVYYQRVNHTDRGLEQAQCSYKKIFEVYEYLSYRKINFVFTCYANLLFPPYIPKRDTTKEFDHWLTNSQVAALTNIPWVPTESMDFLYEYAWRNDYLNDGDHFHPPVHANLKWTDDILLPGLCNQGFISKL